ncbi:MAG: DUF3108 domain-containing protein [candidate division Zixibacteria bacterium]|nr:DUF3108 domain-containing protein [candidate division Zixibacteria bacterium]
MPSYKFLKPLLVAGILFVLAGVCSAQMPGLLGTNMPEMYGKFNLAKVGSYVEYTLISKSTQDEEKLKFSIVGEETTPQGKLYWYEMKINNRNTGETVIMKMLIAGDPKETGNIKRMIVKRNQEKAMEFPPSLLAMAETQAKSKESTASKEKEKVKELGKEKLKTSVGTFDCLHLRYREANEDEADAWTSEKLPIFGLVKFESKSKKMELSSYGKDAVSAITEKPEQLQLPKELGGSGK